MAIDQGTRPDDFVRPGHINPLRSRDGGVLVRTGQTEGSLDLCRLAGLQPAAVIIEIMRDDGEMARVPDLERLCAQHNLKMCSVAQIIEHRLAGESLVRRVGPPGGTPVRTEFGQFNLIALESLVDPLPHVALTVGGVGDLDAMGRPIQITEPTLVRVHRRHLLGDVFGDLDSSREGSTGATLRSAMRLIQNEGRGVIVYLRPEGASEWAGEGPLEPRLQTLRRLGFDRGAEAPDLTHPGGFGAATVPDRIREYGIGSQILRCLGLKKLRLLTNHQTDLPALDAFGLELVDRVPIPLDPARTNS
jgi:3,4-dihydroxy 2-butanone 4-phosphate synthase/GTP cyclohydrolase II